MKVCELPWGSTFQVVSSLPHSLSCRPKLPKLLVVQACGTSVSIAYTVRNDRDLWHLSPIRTLPVKHHGHAMHHVKLIGPHSPARALSTVVCSTTADWVAGSVNAMRSRMASALPGWLFVRVMRCATAP